MFVNPAASIAVGMQVTPIGQEGTGSVSPSSVFIGKLLFYF
jgi:hypothetical protein